MSKLRHRKERDFGQHGRRQKSVYFAASDEWCANYSGGFPVVEVPLAEGTTDAVDDFYLDNIYDYDVFVLL